MSWIPIVQGLPDKPEVEELAIFLAGQFPTLLGLEMPAQTPEQILARERVAKLAALGACLELWLWASRQADHGLVRRATDKQVDKLIGLPGMCQMLERIGWLVVSQHGIGIPNWEYHNSSEAKEKCNAKLRKKRWEEKQNAKGTKLERSGNDSGTVKERQKERSSVPLPLPDRRKSHHPTSPHITSPQNSSAHPTASSDEPLPDDFFDGPPESFPEATDEPPESDPDPFGESSAAQAELALDRELATVLDRVKRFMRTGNAKARATAAKWRRPIASTLDAWKAYEGREGSPAAIGACQAFAHPDEVPARVERASGSWAERELERKSRELRARLARAPDDEPARETPGGGSFGGPGVGSMGPTGDPFPQP